MLELASAYSTFANRGVHVEPRTILEVRRGDGTVIEPERPAPATPGCSTGRTPTSSTTSCARSSSGARAPTPSSASRWPARRARPRTSATPGSSATRRSSRPRCGWASPRATSKKMTKVRGIEVNGGSFPARIFRRYMTEVAKDPQYRRRVPDRVEVPGQDADAAEERRAADDVDHGDDRRPDAATTTTTTAADGGHGGGRRRRPPRRPSHRDDDDGGAGADDHRTAAGVDHDDGRAPPP